MYVLKNLHPKRLVPFKLYGMHFICANQSHTHTQRNLFDICRLCPCTKWSRYRHYCTNVIEVSFQLRSNNAHQMPRNWSRTGIGQWGNPTIFYIHSSDFVNCSKLFCASLVFLVILLLPPIFVGWWLLPQNWCFFSSPTNKIVTHFMPPNRKHTKNNKNKE